MSKKVKISPEAYAAAMQILQEAQSDFGPTMKRKRMALGYTLREFSLFCDISEGRLCEYERLRRYPSAKSFQKILHGFRMIKLDTSSIRELQVAYQNSKLKVSGNSFAKSKN